MDDARSVDHRITELRSDEKALTSLVHGVHHAPGPIGRAIEKLGRKLVGGSIPSHHGRSLALDQHMVKKIKAYRHKQKQDIGARKVQKMFDSFGLKERVEQLRDGQKGIFDRAIGRAVASALRHTAQSEVPEEIAERAVRKAIKKNWKPIAGAVGGSSLVGGTVGGFVGSRRSTRDEKALEQRIDELRADEKSVGSAISGFFKTPFGKKLMLSALVATSAGVGAAGANIARHTSDYHNDYLMRKLEEQRMDDDEVEREARLYGFKALSSPDKHDWAKETPKGLQIIEDEASYDAPDGESWRVAARREMLRRGQTKLGRARINPDGTLTTDGKGGPGSGYWGNRPKEKDRDWGGSAPRDGGDVDESTRARQQAAREGQSSALVPYQPMPPSAIALPENLAQIREGAFSRSQRQLPKQREKAMQALIQDAARLQRMRLFRDPTKLEKELIKRGDSRIEGYARALGVKPEQINTVAFEMRKWEDENVGVSKFVQERNMRVDAQRAKSKRRSIDQFTRKVKGEISKIGWSPIHGARTAITESGRVLGRQGINNVGEVFARRQDAKRTDESPAMLEARRAIRRDATNPIEAAGYLHPTDQARLNLLRTPEGMDNLRSKLKRPLSADEFANVVDADRKKNTRKAFALMSPEMQGEVARRVAKHQGDTGAQFGGILESVRSDFTKGTIVPTGEYARTKNPFTNKRSLMPKMEPAQDRSLGEANAAAELRNESFAERDRASGIERNPSKSVLGKLRLMMDLEGNRDPEAAREWVEGHYSPDQIKKAAERGFVEDETQNLKKHLSAFKLKERFTAQQHAPANIAVAIDQTMTPTERGFAIEKGSQRILERERMQAEGYMPSAISKRINELTPKDPEARTHIPSSSEEANPNLSMSERLSRRASALRQTGRQGALPVTIGTPTLGLQLDRFKANLPETGRQRIATLGMEAESLARRYKTASPDERHDLKDEGNRIRKEIGKVVGTYNPGNRELRGAVISGMMNRVSESVSEKPQVPKPVNANPAFTPQFELPNNLRLEDLYDITAEDLRMVREMNSSISNRRGRESTTAIPKDDQDLRNISDEDYADMDEGGVELGKYGQEAAERGRAARARRARESSSDGAKAAYFKAKYSELAVGEKTAAYHRAKYMELRA